MSWLCCRCCPDSDEKSTTSEIPFNQQHYDEPLLNEQGSCPTCIVPPAPRTPANPEALYVVAFPYRGLEKGENIQLLDALSDNAQSREGFVKVKVLRNGSTLRAPMGYLFPKTDPNDEPWFFPSIDREEAEYILFKAEEEEGLFLVRQCADETVAPFVLSVKMQDADTKAFYVKHYKIFKRGKFFGPDGYEKYVTISAMIEHYLEAKEFNLYKPCPKYTQIDIDRNELRLLEPIGKGQFATVKKAIWRNKIVAVKELRESTESSRAEIAKEMQLLTQFKHAKILKMYGACVTDDEQIMVLEYMALGSLEQYIKNQPLEEQQNLDVLEQIAEGMMFLQKYKVIHRDLAARNILVGDELVVKIADFGLSRKLQGEAYYVSIARKLPVRWLALESLTQHRFTTMSDVWSFGVLAMELYQGGQKPYADFQCTNEELIFRLKQGDRMRQPPNMLDEVYGMIYQCWMAVPEKRPMFHELNSFFKKLGGSEQSEPTF